MNNPYFKRKNNKYKENILMKITVNFDRNWTNNDIEAIANNPNLATRDLNMDVDAYLEVLVVASLMKKNGLSVSDAADKGCAELAAGIEDYFFEEMFEGYTDHYKQILNSEI